MVKHIADYLNKDGSFELAFVEYEDGQDFLDIVDIIKQMIAPDRISYYGFTDMHGEFEKDGIIVNLEFNDMLGNYLVYKGVQTTLILNTIRRWGRIIFDELQKGDT